MYWPAEKAKIVLSHLIFYRPNCTPHVSHLGRNRGLDTRGPISSLVFFFVGGVLKEKKELVEGKYYYRNEQTFSIC
jgi:hypothetical protein